MLFCEWNCGSMPLAALDYFHVLFWPGGGTIGAILWLLSMVMVALVMQSLLTVRRCRLLPDEPRKKLSNMLAARRYDEAIAAAGKGGDLVSGIMHAALLSAPHGYAAMERALGEAADDRTGKLLRSVEHLNLLGNVAPMLGLLGTVWGMIIAFFTIVDKGGNPSPTDLAGALGIKLVCTFVGLVIAIPSLTVYGLMRSRIDAMSAEAFKAAQQMIVRFRSEELSSVED